MKSSENEATGGSGGWGVGGGVEWRGYPDSHLPIPSWGPGSNWESPTSSFKATKEIAVRVPHA